MILQDVCVETTFLDPAKHPNREFEYVDVSSVDRSLLRIAGTTRVLGAMAPSRARKVLRAGDVIFATVRPTLRRIARVPTGLDGHLGSTAFCVIRANQELADSAFLYYAVLTQEFVSSVGAFQRGASYPAVTDKDILGAEILLPGIAEQRAIATVLSKVQAAVEVQDRIVTVLRELKAATMVKLFREGLRGEPRRQSEIGEIPQGWDVVSIDSLFSIRYGLSQPPRIDSSGIPMVRATDIKRGRIVAESVLRVDASSIPERRRAYLRLGEILVVRSGAYTGDVAEYRGPWREAVAGYDLVLTPRTDSTNSSFLAQYLLSEMPQRYFKSTRTRAAQPHLNADQVGAVHVPVPPMADQKEIAGILLGIDRRLLAAVRLKDQLSRLLATVLPAMMTGEVRLTAQK